MGWGVYSYDLNITHLILHYIYTIVRHTYLYTSQNHVVRVPNRLLGGRVKGTRWMPSGYWQDHPDEYEPRKSWAYPITMIVSGYNFALAPVAFWFVVSTFLVDESLIDLSYFEFHVCWFLYLLITLQLAVCLYFMYVCILCIYIYTLTQVDNTMLNDGS